MCIKEQDTKTIPAVKHKSFADFEAAYAWAGGLVNSGIPFQTSRLRDDFFKHVLPRDRAFKMLGFTRKAAKLCKQIEPAGEFRIEIEEPATIYYDLSLLGEVERKTARYRFSCWYSRFLPYAVAMLQAEHGFGATGVDFESINSYFNTCMGFHYLGHDGEGFEAATESEPEYHRIEPADVDLYQDCYAASMKVKSPDLPYDEVHRPCMVYVALHQPWRIARMVDEGHWWRTHIAACCEVMGSPQPDYRKKVA